MLLFLISFVITTRRRFLVKRQYRDERVLPLGEFRLIGCCKSVHAFARLVAEVHGKVSDDNQEIIILWNISLHKTLSSSSAAATQQQQHHHHHHYHFPEFDLRSN